MQNARRQLPHSNQHSRKGFHQTMSIEPIAPSSPSIIGLVKDSAAIAPEALLARVKAYAAENDSTELLNEDSDGTVFVLKVNDRTFTMFIVPQPVPEEEFFATVQKSPKRESLSRIVKEHQAHIVMGALSPVAHFGDTVTQSIFLMKFAAKMSGLVLMTGLFWLNSQELLDKVDFTTACARAHDVYMRNQKGEKGAGSGLPYPYWVSLRLFSDKTDAGPELIAGRTHGLAAYLGYEVEITFLPRPPAEMMERLRGVVGYLFASGPVLQHGHSIGLSADEQFVVSFETTEGQEAPTAMLRLQPARMN
ncbi:MAG: DUF4261 domain-containing protein [Pseudomonadota bacterium]